MKYSVSSYSFSQYLKDGRLTAFSCIQKAKELGFDAVEFVELSAPEGKTLSEYATELAQEAARVGIEISNYAVGADFISGSGGDIEKEIARVCAQVGCCKASGLSVMLHDVNRRKNSS